MRREEQRSSGSCFIPSPNLSAPQATTSSKYQELIAMDVERDVMDNVQQPVVKWSLSESGQRVAVVRLC